MGAVESAFLDSAKAGLFHASLARRVKCFFIAKATHWRTAGYGLPILAVNILIAHQLFSLEYSAYLSSIEYQFIAIARQSFMKTLKCQEIHANEYGGIEDLRDNVASFVDVYYNTQRLHSALGYNTPEQFEAKVRPATAAGDSKLSFSRHWEIYQSDLPWKRSRPKAASRIIVLMSLRLAIPRQVGLHQSPAPLHQPRSS